MAGGSRAGTGEDRDRDEVDFSWLVSGLRRMKLLGPPRPAVEEQLTLFTSPTRPRDKLQRALHATRQRPSLRMAEPTTIAADVRARLLLAAAILGYIAVFMSWTFRNQDGLGTQAFDLGIFDQGVWLLSRLHRPFVTINGRNLFGDHTSFILLPFAAVYRLLPDAKVLLASQTLALGGAAVPAFLLARHLLRNEMLAALLSVAYLLHPVVGWTNLEQFHPDAFEVPLVLFALSFMVRHRWIGYFVCVGLLLLVKEDVALLTFALGVYVAVRHDKRAGLITCLVSAVYFVAAFWLIIPALNPGGTVYTGRIAFGGPAGFLHRALTSPGDVISHVTSGNRPWYVWQLLASVGLVCLFAPAVLLIALGPLAVNLASGFPYQHDIQFHYSTLIVPVVGAAAVFAVAREPAGEYRNGAVAIVLGASLVCAYLWGPTPLGRADPFVADTSTPTVESFRRAQRILPDDAVVSAYYRWVPQVGHRREIYMFPNPFRASYWGTFKQEGRRLPQAERVQYILVPSQLDPEPRSVLDHVRPGFETVYESEGVLLLRRQG